MDEHLRDGSTVGGSFPANVTPQTPPYQSAHSTTTGANLKKPSPAEAAAAASSNNMGNMGGRENGDHSTYPEGATAPSSKEFTDTAATNVEDEAVGGKASAGPG